MGLTFNRFSYIAFITSLFFQIVFCSSPEYAGGVETTNGLTIAIKKDQIQGIAPALSQIVLCDTSYAVYVSFLPITKFFIDTTYADESGKFKFDQLPDGFYNIIGRTYNADSGTIIKNIFINRLNTTELLKSSEYLSLGSVTGAVSIDSTSVGLSALICVMGTDLRDTTDRFGEYTITKVPVGACKITGSFCRKRTPEMIDYYLSTIDSITVPENAQIGVDLNLEKKY